MGNVPMTLHFGLRKRQLHETTSLLWSTALHPPPLDNRIVMHCVPVDSSLYLSFTWHVPLLKNSTENRSIISFVKIHEIDKGRGDLQTYKYPLHTERDFVARGMDQKSGHHPMHWPNDFKWTRVFCSSNTCFYFKEMILIHGLYIRSPQEKNPHGTRIKAPFYVHRIGCECDVYLPIIATRPIRFNKLICTW